jgi:hypothetical protein
MTTPENIRWFKQQFGEEIKQALAGSPFDLDMLVAIASQETGYIWSRLRKKDLALARIVALCVGDTIDYKGPKDGRQVFPLNKKDLLSRKDGDKMFAIARAALEDMAAYVPGYDGAVANPNKFCHGYGVFQRDLQFFKDDPDYFLEKKYEIFGNSLAHCLQELKRGLKTLGFENKDALTDAEFACVAIAYNKGSYNPKKGLKQGHFDGKKYYGEWIDEYVRLSRSVAIETRVVPGHYAVIARNGLKLRGGPGTNFTSLRTLAEGTELDVVSLDGANSDWARVDLEGDGLLDGYVFAAFLARAHALNSAENAPEPD